MNMLTGQGLRQLLRVDNTQRRESMHMVEPADWGFTVDEQGFVRNSDHLCSSIEALRGRHTAFEGVPLSPMSGTDWNAMPSSRRRSITGMASRPISAARSAGGASEDDGNFEGTFHERFQAYKYYRRFEREEASELSPSAMGELTRNASCPSSLGKNTSIMKYNASDEALQLWVPEAKKQRAASKKTVRRTRAEEAGIQREQLMMANSIRWAKELKRKKDQGDTAIASRRNQSSSSAWSTLGLSSSTFSPPTSPKGDSTLTDQMRSILAEQWIRLFMVTSVTQQLQKGLHLTKLDHQDQMTFLAKQHPSSHRILMRSATAKRAVEMDELSRNLKPFSKCLATLVVCFKTALRVRKQRQNANCVLDCMIHWQFAGRAFVAMRRFATWIRKLQRWWRQASKRLKEIRNGVCARWEKLEKAALLEEEQKRQESYAKTGARFWGTPSASSSEAVRMRFVENELRARRVELLPLLYIWEEDVRKWRKDLEEWRETRAAHKALGVDGGGCFRWPPTRPSYIPPSHPNHEAWGSECPEECPGRRGDAQILEMWRAARKHPKGEGWKKIPCAACGDCAKKFSDAKAKPSGSRSKASKSKTWEGGSAEASKDLDGLAGRGSTSAYVSPFGEVATDEELRHWGVDAATLPGL